MSLRRVAFPDFCEPFLYAFDLIELDGDDPRHEPIERRKAVLAKLIRRAKTGLVLNEHIG